MEHSNTIRARHLQIIDGKTHIKDKDYFWHIPKRLRYRNIKKGDIVLVQARDRKEEAIVVDVFREEDKEIKKKYKSVLSKPKVAGFHPDTMKRLHDEINKVGY